MPKLADQAYLLSSQYKNASNLNIRIDFHRRFGTEPGKLQHWMFDQYDLPAQSRILELGTGPGDLWRENLERIPSGWELTLSDFSEGMLAKAQENLQSGGTSFDFKLIDAQSIPFDDGHFDAVIANFMLYHVPDRAKALSEIRRVLKPGGRFYAMTTGRNHLRELREWVGQFGLKTMMMASSDSQKFDFEAAIDEVAPYFSAVDVRRYEYPLAVTELEPLLEYTRSMAGKDEPLGDRFSEFVEFVTQKLAQEKTLRITRSSGMLMGLV